MMRKFTGLCCLLLLAFFACKKPYNPPVIAANSNYLVVEGTISTGEDSTIIKLSRTVKLSSATVANPELHAVVSVLSDANVSYPLREIGNGYYAAPALGLNSSNKYSLKIVAPNGKTYQSDFVAVKNSPPVDSINYIVQSDRIQINLNTHDPANKTIYYRWSYNETYVIHAHDESDYILDTVPVDTIVLRTAAQQVYTCWATDTSSIIYLGSSADLKQDVISQFPLASIAYTDERIGSRYSILVKQYALTPEAYNYWKLVKKNTEQLGSIFDAQPSQLPGNIHCVSTPSEPVIGYLSAGSAAKKRIFIDSHDLPALQPKIPVSADGCYVGVYLYRRMIGPGQYLNDIPTWIYSGRQFVLTSVVPLGSHTIIGWKATDRFCGDCTLRGSNVQPDFWTY